MKASNIDIPERQALWPELARVNSSLGNIDDSGVCWLNALWAQDTPVTDWSFVNDVPLCQIQVSALGLPHSVNVNCMATPDGQLFLSCSACERKFWGRHVKDNDHGRLRLNGRVYPVVFNRVMDQAVLDRAWAARVKKLQVYGGGPYNPVPPPDAKRPKDWSTFQLRSAI